MVKKTNNKTDKDATPRRETPLASEVVRGAAVHAGRVARRLLRRTHSLARQAAAPPPAAPAEAGRLASPAQAQAQDDELLRLRRDVTLLHRRLARAEHAAAWLRARLRSERSRRGAAPRVDGAALADTLAVELARLPSPRPEVVRRLVARTLAAHGIPVPSRDNAGTETDPATIPGWTAARQERVTAQVLARAPEVADPFYVHRALQLVSAQGRVSLPEIFHGAGLGSAMARRRLRLAVEALTALGVLAWQDGQYALADGGVAPRQARDERRLHTGRQNAGSRDAGRRRAPMPHP